MNERIRLLAEQAGITTNIDTDYYEKDMNKWVDYFSEKFAELIVKECAELIDNKVMITAAQTYDEIFVAKFDTKELCAKQIREHFGVEE